MKKRRHVYFSVFTMSIFCLLISNVVFGESLAEQVFREHRATILDDDIQPLLPDILSAFRKPETQNILSPHSINTILNNPGTLTVVDPEVDYRFVGLLTINEGLQVLFANKQFQTLLQTPAEIDRLIRLIPKIAPPPPPEPPVESEPKTLSIVYGNNQLGEVDISLAHPFVVGVLDQEGKPLQGTTVTFTLTPGDGWLSVISQTTNVYGQARTILTPTRAGDISVVARVTGLSPQEFTAKATAPKGNDGSSTSEPSLPSMYWIESNTIYHRPIRGGKKTFFEPEDGVTLKGGLAVDTVGGRVYWTEKLSGMGEMKGRIRSRSLDKQTVGEGKTIKAEPLGIAVGTDRANDRWVYWTNSAKKIQRIKIDNSGMVDRSFEGNFRVDLDSPKHIAFDAEQKHLYYWTERGHIRAVYPNGRWKNLVAENLRDLGGIAVFDGTVYWTERIGTEQGTLQGAVKSVNGNGSHRKLLAGLESIPEGIAVDAVEGKVYWTTSRGYIQSAPLGGIIEPVIEGNDTRAVGLAVVSSPIDKMGAAPSVTVPLISSVVSVENTLLANYPNPFNPETWIPYQLSASADVSVSIYAVDGRLVRRLELGHQAAGVYQSQSRAAYWDGRNAFGERVASGLYFYTLTAGDFTATRKMLIRK